MNLNKAAAMPKPKTPQLKDQPTSVDLQWPLASFYQPLVSYVQAVHELKPNPTPGPKPLEKVKPASKEGKQDMYLYDRLDATKELLPQQLNLLRTQLADDNTIDRALQDDFNTRPIYPKNFKEAKAMTAAGQFSVVKSLGWDNEDEGDDDDENHSFLIKWGDPARKTDLDGYNSAYRNFNKARHAAMVSILAAKDVETAKGVYDAFKALPSKTFHDTSGTIN